MPNCYARSRTSKVSHPACILATAALGSNGEVLGAAELVTHVPGLICYLSLRLFTLQSETKRRWQGRGLPRPRLLFEANAAQERLKSRMSANGIVCGMDFERG